VSLSLGRLLSIRSMTQIAGEAIPFFWPMRTFIHHNPLYGLEHMPFQQAVAEGGKLFHGRGYLGRPDYQRYLAAGRIDADKLAEQITRFADTQPALPELHLHRLLTGLMTECGQTPDWSPALAGADDIHAILHGSAVPNKEIDAATLAALIQSRIHFDRPLYHAVDRLFGTDIGKTLDELVIKSCLDFFDEGQSVWRMPGRDQGLFQAWSAVARRNLRLFIRGLHIKRILAADESPEGIISHVMTELGIPEESWMDYFTAELTRLHGWAGFIRWRTGAKRHHWSRNYPADLIDYLAIRLVLGLALLREHAQSKGTPGTFAELARYIDAHPAEAYLRCEFHSGQVIPAN